MILFSSPVFMWHCHYVQGANNLSLTDDAPEKSGQVMIIAGLNCCSKSASISFPDLSGNVYKDFKGFNEHSNPHLL
jgi:hypothetical protein